MDRLRTLRLCILTRNLRHGSGALTPEVVAPMTSRGSLLAWLHGSTGAGATMEAIRVVNRCCSTMVWAH